MKSFFKTASFLLAYSIFCQNAMAINSDGNDKIQITSDQKQQVVDQRQDKQQQKEKQNDCMAKSDTCCQNAAAAAVARCDKAAKDYDACVCDTMQPQMGFVPQNGYMPCVSGSLEKKQNSVNWNGKLITSGNSYERKQKCYMDAAPSCQDVYNKCMEAQ